MLSHRLTLVVSALKRSCDQLAWVWYFCFVLATWCVVASTWGSLTDPMDGCFFVYGCGRSCDNHRVPDVISSTLITSHWCDGSGCWCVCVCVCVHMHDWLVPCVFVCVPWKTAQKVTACITHTWWLHGAFLHSQFSFILFHICKCFCIKHLKCWLSVTAH